MAWIQSIKKIKPKRNGNKSFPDLNLWSYDDPLGNAELILGERSINYYEEIACYLNLKFA
jgi:hypothetical protein